MKVKNNKAFTLIEMMVGLSLGVLVLTGLVSFFFRTSKMVDMEQKTVKDLNQLQATLNKISEDIKSVNTVEPRGGATTITDVTWKSLPYMPVGRTFDNTITQPPVSSYPKEYPVYPFAYNYSQYQSGFIGDPSKGIFPIEDPTSNCKESNELTFYKVENNQITRVLYYTEPDPSYPVYSICSPLRVIRLKRKQQYGILSTSTSFNDASLTTKDEVILSNLKYVQFSYPLLTEKLSDSSSPNYDSALATSLGSVAGANATEKAYYQGMLIMPYRNLIKVKIGTSGPQIGNEKVVALELSTEVNVRN